MTGSEPLLALFCSRQVPGAPILLAYDLAIALREAGIAVISGFHTPVERDCLDFLLKGEQPIVYCPARGPFKSIPMPLRAAVDAGRLSFRYPFETGNKRQTGDLARKRNQFVAEQATALFVIHAEPGSNTEAVAHWAIAQGKPVFTFDLPENANLLQLGAIGLPRDVIRNPAALRTALGWSGK